MDRRKIKRWMIVLGLVLGAVALGSLFWVFARPTTDEQRYAALQYFGKTHRRIDAKQVNWNETAVALLHGSRPEEYYLKRYETEVQALLGSGYLVEVLLPVPGLATRQMEVRARLWQTSERADAFYEAAVDIMKDEVRLVCRKQDVAFWKKALAEEARR